MPSATQYRLSQQERNVMVEVLNANYPRVRSHLMPLTVRLPDLIRMDALQYCMLRICTCISMREALSPLSSGYCWQWDGLVFLMGIPAIVDEMANQVSTVRLSSIPF
jgi:hypothetical protein